MLRGMQMSYSVSARSFTSCLTGLLLLPVLGFSVTGCVYGSVPSVLRAQIAAEMDCPEMRVRTRPIYEVGSVPGQYTASGCGIKRIYECPQDAGMVSYDEQVCSLLEDPLAKKVRRTGSAQRSDDRRHGRRRQRRHQWRDGRRLVRHDGRRALARVG